MPTELKQAARPRRTTEPTRLGAIVDGATNTLVCPGGIVAAFHAAQFIPQISPALPAAAITLATAVSTGLGVAFLARSMQTYRGPALRARYFAAALATGIAGYGQIDNDPIPVAHLKISEKVAAGLSHDIRTGTPLPFCRGASLEPLDTDRHVLKMPKYCAYFLGGKPVR